MNRRLVVVLSVLAVLVSCNRGVTPASIEGRIGLAITDRCRSAAKCIIQLRDVTPFEWDRMFYFDYGVSPAARQTAVGSPFRTAELQRQLIFLRNGRVIRNDLLPTDVEKPIENELDFDGGEHPNLLTCDNAARFEVKRDSLGTGVVFFQLKAVSGKSCR